MRFEFRAGMRSHAAADSDGEMIAAREGPDVAFEVREKFYGDGVGGLRNEITLGHFQFVAMERARFGGDLIACASGQDEEIRAVPFAIDGVARLGRAGIHAENVSLL